MSLTGNSLGAGFATKNANLLDMNTGFGSAFVWDSVCRSFSLRSKMKRNGSKTKKKLLSLVRI